MLIRLTKLSDLKHRMTAVRADGSTATVELVSRSFLIHDFIHYAVETAAGLSGGFWGLLASGKGMEELALAMRPSDGIDMTLLAGEAATVEAVVGCFTGLAQDRATPEESVDAVRRMIEPQGRPPPDWVTLDFARTVQERLRRLRGEWKALPYGGTMELRFPAASGEKKR
ncbi:MAG: hypothetical protein IT534_09615 [Bauldia sp.]|nr:hypothetical protein [Bauldia sp.]